MPAAEHLRLEATTAVGGQSFTVTANEQATLVSAQGELGRLPPLGQAFAIVELRSADGEVLEIAYGSTPPQVSRGRAVRLEELQLAGLRDEAAQDETARAFACPHCGAPVQVQLEGTRSITCPSCDSLIDVSRGLAGELRHAEQHEPVRPLIPLGCTGQLQGTQWQVLGFQHRMGSEPGDGDEHFGWSEYLLYNRQRGFLFLVDTEEGWSLVRTTTGAPALSSDQQSASYLGTRYPLKSSYQARDQLRGRRVLLAGRARPAQLPPRLRQRQQDAVDGAVGARGHLVQRHHDRQRRGGQGLRPAGQRGRLRARRHRPDQRRGRPAAAACC